MPIATVNNTPIAYELNESGKEIVLLLPGLGTGMSYFNFVEPLLRKDFTTLQVDPRGIGKSVSADKEYTAEIWADDFAALLKHLGIRKAHVIGSSHGGSMAMAMADRYPDAMASLMILGGFSELNTGMEINMRLRINIVSKLGMGPEIADHVTLWTNRAEFLDTPQGKQAVKTIHEAVMKNEPARYIAMLRSVQHWGRVLPEQKGEPKFTARLPGIRVPTLAVSGDSDHFIPASLSKLIAAKIPGARYHEIAQCGHIAVHEKPEETAGVLAEFINKVSTSPRG
jgi:pimeloyl-ACP methyl ester carboxylesterase